MSTVSPIVARLANRSSKRTESEVQSDIRQLLLTAPFELTDHHLEEVSLEAQVGDRRRIDVEVGFTVIEVKRDLTRGRVLDEAILQLEDYVQTRTRTLGQRYVGVLTDGVDWHLYHLTSSGSLTEVSRLTVNSEQETDRLVVWLESVLATSNDIAVNPVEIERRLGAESSAHLLERSTLRALYDANKNKPTVKLKRELWARLLTTALGTQFEDSDELFVEHTLLVNTAEIIAHGVVGFDLAEVNPASLISGALFTNVRISGVVEADFFDWVIEVPSGDTYIKTLARRLARFKWDEVEHDVMKVLYESVIDTQHRKRLGEYYTPDWLAQNIVEEVIDNGTEQKVLDPACGSGTFLFHAVRTVLAAHEDLPYTKQLEKVTHQVFGVDLHPVAVTLARVTYLLAIGRDRLNRDDRPPIHVPVYLGDSLQWSQQVDLLSSESLVIPTQDGLELFANELRFPRELLRNSHTFDKLVSELAKMAGERTTKAVPPLGGVFRRYVIPERQHKEIEATFKVLCRLHDEGRDHIWGYYVRNLARPIWLSEIENRVDALIGNPPWLAYRNMPTDMQETFRSMSEQRNLWAGKRVATNQDLSGLFLARAVELYLRNNGKFGMVMPHAALSRRQYEGFRAGEFGSTTETAQVEFNVPWDLHAIKPSFFPVPSAVVFGTRTNDARPLPEKSIFWSGKLPTVSAAWEEVKPHLTSTLEATPAANDATLSPYKKRFAQGATVTPRMLLSVEPVESRGLGAGAGRQSIRSRRSNNEKQPWKSLESLEGNVETEFVRQMFLGENILPYRLLDPLLAVIPWDGTHLLNGNDEQIDRYPGLAQWWKKAEKTWNENRSSDKLTLTEQLNYMRKLTGQFPAAEHRVVYTKSGTRLAAAKISEPKPIIDHKLYWTNVSSENEAHYLCSILNSPATTKAVQPLQSRGNFGPRDFDKYVWQLPIPLFDDQDPTHIKLVELAKEAELLALNTDIGNSKFQKARKIIRDVIAECDIGLQIDEIVNEMLSSR